MNKLKQLFQSFLEYCSSFYEGEVSIFEDQKPTVKPEPKEGGTILSVFTAEELCNIIESRMKELGRNITNAELNELISNKAIEMKRIIGASEEKIDSDLMVGNLREEGVKIRSINEEMRKKDTEKKKEDEA